MNTASLQGMNVAENDLKEVNRLRKDIAECWARVAYSAKSNIKFLSDPLCEAMHKAREKFRKDEVLNAVPSQNGVFLFNRGYSELFAISNNEQDITGVIYFFYKNIIAGFTIFKMDKATQFLSTKGFKTHNINDPDGSGSIVSRVFLRLNFLKYAEIETKILPPNKKVKEIDCKYLNETNYNIEYIDSKWFTNIINNNPFWVRGHFRFQPCGEGLKDKKLIFIDPFQKQGYAALAKKLNIGGIAGFNGGIAMVGERGPEMKTKT